VESHVPREELGDRQRGPRRKEPFGRRLVGQTQDEYGMLPGSASPERLLVMRGDFPRQPETGLAADELMLMTLRSEGQFNTVVYEDEDLYRGNTRRDVVMMAGEDAARPFVVGVQWHPEEDAADVRLVAALVAAAAHT